MGRDRGLGVFSSILYGFLFLEGFCWEVVINIVYSLVEVFRLESWFSFCFSLDFFWDLVFEEFYFEVV